MANKPRNSVAPTDPDTERFLRELRQRNPHEPEFLQAVGELVEGIMLDINKERCSSA